MKDLTGAYIENKLITIEHYAPRPRKNPEQTFTNIYIKELPPDIDSDEKLRQLFSQFGKVKSPKLKTTEDKKPLPFGYCSMETHEEAVEAVKGLNGKVEKYTTPEGEEKTVTLVADRHKSKEERRREIAAKTAKFKRDMYQKTRRRNFYIRGFDEHTDEETIRREFEKYGPIASLKIKPVENSTRRFGFICFEKDEDADKAFEDCLNIKINAQPIFLAYFKPAETRQRESQSQHGFVNTKSSGQSPGAISMSGAPQVPIQMGGAQGSIQMSGATGPVMMNFPTNTVQDKPRDKLKVAILEECDDQAIGDTQPYINYLKKISDDQCARLNSLPRPQFLEWFNAIPTNP